MTMTTMLYRVSATPKDRPEEPARLVMVAPMEVIGQHFKLRLEAEWRIAREALGKGAASLYSESFRDDDFTVTVYGGEKLVGTIRSN